ncbi:MAG: NAD-dependent epimerase/dehydratase family protein [Pseudomonadota bacterium]
MKRRAFLAASSALGLTTGLAALGGIQGTRVLVLGGTGFFGPVLVRELLRNGANVTLFNRGQTNPHLFPQIEKIRGDRELPDARGLVALAESRARWDWVVDTWQGSSACVADTARLLHGRVEQYQYVSTVSVYDKWDRIGIQESEPLNPVPPGPEPLVSPHRYALRKTLSEQLLGELLPERSVFFRSHGMRGYPNSAPKHEPYWQVKIMRGGDLVLPADIEYYQVTDMVSLARFMIHCGRTQQTGPFNVCYPPIRLRRFIEGIVRDTRSGVRLHWIPQEFLLAHQVRLLRGTPAGRYRFDVSKALAAGLENRSLSELLADQLQGYRDRHPGDDFRFGGEGTSTISSQREQEIIRLWRERRG